MQYIPEAQRKIRRELGKNNLTYHCKDKQKKIFRLGLKRFLNLKFQLQISTTSAPLVKKGAIKVNTVRQVIRITAW